MSVDPGRNYFELFGLPAAFDIDADELAARYRELLRRLHPDKYASGSDQERRLSLQKTTLVNEAFRVLRDPIRRARYLLGLGGVDPAEDTDTAMDPAFLAEQLELRESLNEARQDAAPLPRLSEIAADVDRHLREKTEEFRRSLARGAAGRDRARAAVREMQFLDKLRREIGDLEEELA
jgi:molecular chaperone HscB